MTRYYCDICGAEIPGESAGSRAVGMRRVSSGRRLSVEIMTAVDGRWNGGHACIDCIRDACASAVFPSSPPADLDVPVMDAGTYFTPAEIAAFAGGDDAGEVGDE